MSLNFDSYLAALNAFYQEAAYWKYETITETGDKSNRLKSLQKKAKQLNNELKKLPPEMIRPQVVEHVQKALSL